MRTLWFSILAALAATLFLCGADWPTQGGSPQRSGWARSERLLDKNNVENLRVLYTYQAENVSNGVSSLTSPIINGNLITYRGFKEMLLFGASSDKVFSVDADLNKLLWVSKMKTTGGRSIQKSPTLACPGGLTAPVMMAGSSSAALHFAADASRTSAALGTSRVRTSPYFPSLDRSVYPLTPTTLSQLAALYAVSSDGRLHVLNSSTGEDLLPPVKFLPPESKVTSLNIWENVVYATTADNCDGYQNALFAMDLLSVDKHTVSFAPEAGSFAGTSGTAIGNDGTVYVHVISARKKSAEQLHETVYALTPRELKQKDYFTLENKPGRKEDRKASGSKGGITPLVFSSQGKDLILAGAQDGCLYLLDSKSLGGTDHRTPLFASDPTDKQAKHPDGSGVRGAFSSWVDVDTNTRWFYAPVYGSPNLLAASNTQGTSMQGGIVAFKFVQESSKPALLPAWVSPEIAFPAPVVIANGIVFALSTGKLPPDTKKHAASHGFSKFDEMSSPATLYAFDAVTGKRLYSSGNAVKSDSPSGGLAVANGRVYFTTRDDSVYCFGIPAGQSQLREQ